MDAAALHPQRKKLPAAAAVRRPAAAATGPKTGFHFS